MNHIIYGLKMNVVMPMERSFTPSDLTAYIYGETSQLKSNLIRRALTTNIELREEYQAMKSAHRELNDGMVEPRACIVQAILDYSRHTDSPVWA